MIPGGLPANCEHIALDFLQSPSAIPQVLKEHNIHADHVFFFSYIQPAPKAGKGLWSDADEMTRVNKALLDNFLSGLSGAGITPKRFMLQTGAKNYGGYLGPTKLPQEEWHPRVEYPGEPNFYYAQEDSLWAWCKANGCGWNVCMPGPILGAVPDAAMNAAFPLAVYAAVCKKLGERFEFPSDVASWQMYQSMSASMMNAYMEEWAVLTDVARDQKFNTCDSSSFAWEGCWPRIAGWYGIEWKGPHPEMDHYTERETPVDPPPRGYGPRGVTKIRFSMVSWAKREKVVKAWRELAEENGLADKELRDVERVFGFLDGTVCRSSALTFSMDKSRKMGWHGFVDSSEAFLEVFDDLARIKMIPPVPKVVVKFN